MRGGGAGGETVPGVLAAKLPRSGNLKAQKEEYSLSEAHKTPPRSWLEAYLGRALRAGVGSRRPQFTAMDPAKRVYVCVCVLAQGLWFEGRQRSRACRAWSLSTCRL